MKENLGEIIKNVGKDIDLSEPLKFSSKNEDILLSVPKLMALGILYCLSNSKLRAEKFYELIQSEMEDTIDTFDLQFNSISDESLQLVARSKDADDRWFISDTQCDLKTEKACKVSFVEATDTNEA